jgi:hypothetical protein
MASPRDAVMNLSDRSRSDPFGQFLNPEAMLTPRAGRSFGDDDRQWPRLEFFDIASIYRTNSKLHLWLSCSCSRSTFVDQINILDY